MRAIEELRSVPFLWWLANSRHLALSSSLRPMLDPRPPDPSPRPSVPPPPCAAPLAFPLPLPGLSPSARPAGSARRFLPARTSSGVRCLSPSVRLARCATHFCVASGFRLHAVRNKNRSPPFSRFFCRLRRGRPPALSRALCFSSVRSIRPSWGWASVPFACCLAGLPSSILSRSCPLVLLNRLP